MLRGRRVFYVILSLVISYLLLEKTHQISVTASVQASKEWQTSIAQESQIELESQSIAINQPIKISIHNKGLSQVTLLHQNVQISVLRDQKLIQQQVLISNNDGVIGFAYVPTIYGDYQFKFENVTYEQPIILEKKISFSLNSSPINSLVSLIAGIFTGRGYKE